MVHCKQRTLVLYYRRVPCITNLIALPELLDKALEFGNKAYSANMSTFAFLERAMEDNPKHTDLTDEIVGLAD